jgi:hypothetical protein
MTPPASSAAKPLTPVKNWENVPRKRSVDALVGDMISRLQLSPEKRSRISLGEPTYLPYDHSHDLLGAVITLQTTCEQLSQDVQQNRESLTHDLFQVSEQFTRDSQHQSDAISELVRETRGLREAREKSNTLLERQAINLE